MSRLLELTEHCYSMMRDNSISEQDKEDYRNMLRETKAYLDNLVMIRDDYKQQKSSETADIKVEPNQPTELIDTKVTRTKNIKRPIKNTSRKKTSKNMTKAK